MAETDRGRDQDRLDPTVTALQARVADLERRLNQVIQQESAALRLVERAPFGVLVFEAQPARCLSLLLANAAAEKVLGQSLDGQSDPDKADIAPLLGVSGLADTLHRIAVHGGAWAAERVGYSDDGRPRVLRLRAFQTEPMRIAVLVESAAKDGDGFLTGSSAPDRAQHTARRAQDMIFRTDARGTILFVSASSVELFGLESDEMIGHHFTEFLSEESVDSAVASFRASMAGRHTASALMLRMRGRHGVEFDGELRSSVTMEAGVPTGTLGVIRCATR